MRLSTGAFVASILTTWLPVTSIVVASPLKNREGQHLSTRDYAEDSGFDGFCYPALGFQAPEFTPPDGWLDDWWCNQDEEYAFVGFSYEITACQDYDQLMADFSDIRNNFNSRYIRLYGFCDTPGYYNTVVQAAYQNTLGVHALIWFGFNQDDSYIARKDELFYELHSNPLAKFVTRVVQYGSEPLFDDVLPPNTAKNLTHLVLEAKRNLSSLHIPITVSELAYGFQESNNSQELLNVIDQVNIHMLPFFDWDASTANNSWPDVLNDLDWFIAHSRGKKLSLDENGWPSVTSPSVQPNSPNAVANVQNEHDYATLLDDNCEYFKNLWPPVSWFWHIYSDNMEPGYGLYDSAGQQKFPFQPRTHC